MFRFKSDDMTKHMNLLVLVVSEHVFSDTYMQIELEKNGIPCTVDIEKDVDGWWATSYARTPDGEYIDSWSERISEPTAFLTEAAAIIQEAFSTRDAYVESPWFIGRWTDV